MKKNSGKHATHKQQRAHSRGHVVNQGLPVARVSQIDTGFEIHKHPKFKDALVVHGTEYIDQLSSPATTVAGQCLLNQPVSPADFPGTRLELFSRMYEKYRFRRLKFKYLPSAAYDKFGSIILAYDRDPSDATPPAGAAGVHQYQSWESTKSGDIKAPIEIDCRLAAPDAGYYVNDVPGGDERLSDQGQVYVACLTPLSPSISIGSLLLEYECELFVPNMENPAPLAVSASPPVSATNTQDIIFKLAQAFNNAATPGVLSQSADPQYTPKDDGTGTKFIRLAEGLYRATMAGINNGGTNQAPNPPTLRPLEPKTAPAPQPQVQNITTVPTSIDGAAYSGDFLLNVPSGGADMFWNSVDSLANDVTKIQLQKIAKSYWTDALSAFVA